MCSPFDAQYNTSNDWAGLLRVVSVWRQSIGRTTYAAGRPGPAGHRASSGIVVGNASGHCLAVDRPYQLVVVRTGLVAGRLVHFRRRWGVEMVGHHSADTLDPVGARQVDLLRLAEPVLGLGEPGAPAPHPPYARYPPPSFVLSIPFGSP